MEPVFNGSLSDSLGKVLNTTSIYGNDQKFDELKKKAIHEMCEFISELRYREDPDNFKKMLAKAGALRNNIAYTTETEGSELFGDERTSGDFMSTLLSTEAYKETNNTIKELILDCLALMPDKTKTRRKTLDNSRYTFKLLKENTLLFEDPFAMFQKMMSGKHNDTDESNFAMNHLIEHKQKTLPLLYALQGKKISKADITKDQNMYIFVGRVELQTDNEWRTLTRHVTVLKHDSNGEIDIDDFKSHGIVALLHTSYRDIPLHQKPMSILCNKILSFQTPSDQLDALIREFEYRLHQITYYRRGSAACYEIILEAIKITIHPAYTLKGNLKALANPYFSTYLK